MRVLVACEFSGVVRRAFASRGHDAWSCDLVPAEDGSNQHIVGDARDLLDQDWDLLIVCHPPCTRTCLSGLRWLHSPPWQHGHGETKRMLLWLKNLPVLRPTNVVEGRMARVHRMSPGGSRYDRRRERSRFYPGVAEAFADQWGSLYWIPDGASRNGLPPPPRLVGAVNPISA